MCIGYCYHQSIVQKLIPHRPTYNSSTPTAGAPLFVMCVALTAVSTVVLDQQMEMRHARLASITNREMTLQQEHDTLKKFLLDTEDHYENKELPAGVGRANMM